MIIKKENGLSLVELMVTAGLMGGMALVGMTMMKNQTKSQRSADQQIKTLQSVFG